MSYKKPSFYLSDSQYNSPKLLRQIRRKVEIDDAKEKLMEHNDPAHQVVEIKQAATRLQELLGTTKPYEAQLDEVDKIGLNILRNISRIAAWSDTTRAQLHKERNKL